MPRIVTAGPGFHIGDCMLAQTIDGDRIVDKKPNVIQGYKLDSVRLSSYKKIAVGDGLKACACNQLDISWLPLCAESYQISPDISDYVLVSTPIVLSTFPNRNLDAFPYGELTAWRPMIGRACYATFIGKPVHQDHQNEDPTKAKGVIFDATLAPFRGKWHVSILKGFDRSKDARLAKLVQEKNRVGHSMGTLVERTECSYPKCRFISDGVTTCEHIRGGEGKGQVISGHLIYELLRDFNFVESSSVEDNASATALSDYFLEI
jgi:hypothetical protein